jgi:hypothetical protein
MAELAQLSTTAAARSATEFWRVLTHTMSGFLTYVISTAAAVSFQGRNLLQKPNNCDWGLEFDGPLAPLTDEAIEASKRKRRRLNETKTTTLKAKAGSGSSSLSASETTSSVKRLAATPITPEVEEGELR